MARRRAVIRPLGSALVLAVLLCFAATAGADPAAERAAAEDLAHRVYYEGVPEALAGTLGAAGVERLIELLGEPGHASAHANALILLGMAGRDGTFEALADFAAAAPRGAVDRAMYRARRALPEAMGYLARRDDRALEWLMARAADEAPPDWRFGTLAPERIGARLRGNALLGLGLSGRPEARAHLEAVSATSPDPALARRARRALDLHDRTADPAGGPQ